MAMTAWREKDPQQEKRASMRENLILLQANKKGTDQPVHLHRLISAFNFCPVESIRAKYTSYMQKIQYKLVSVAEQAWLSLTLIAIPERQIYSRRGPTNAWPNYALHPI